MIKGCLVLRKSEESTHSLRVISKSYFNKFEGKLLESSKGNIVVIYVIFSWRQRNKMSNLDWIEHFYSLAMTVCTVVPKAWQIFVRKVSFVHKCQPSLTISILFKINLWTSLWNVIVSGYFELDLRCCSMATIGDAH